MGRKQLKVPSVWRPLDEFINQNQPSVGRISEDFSNRSAVRVSVAGLRNQGRMGESTVRHSRSDLSCALGWCDRACPTGSIGNTVNFMSAIHDWLAGEAEDGKIPQDKAIDLYETACYIYLKKPSRGTGLAIASAKRKILGK